MNTTNKKTIVVAGGTGNVGSNLVRSLLKDGTTVVVPSRSKQKTDGLRDHLSNYFPESVLEHLHTYTGNLSDEKEADELQKSIITHSGKPDGVVATLGNLVPAPSLLETTVSDMETVLHGYLIAHFMVAKTFLPGLRDNGGTYIFINGPLALKPWKGSGTGLVSIATAAQQMLFHSLAQELEDSKVKVSEVITYAFIRNRQTQPGSTLTGEQLGDFVSRLVTGKVNDIHGKSFQIQSREVIEKIIG